MLKSEAQKDAEFRAAISRHAAGMTIRKIVPRQVTVQAGEYLIGELTTPDNFDMDSRDLHAAVMEFEGTDGVDTLFNTYEEAHEYACTVNGQVYVLPATVTEYLNAYGDWLAV